MTVNKFESKKHVKAKMFVLYFIILIGGYLLFVYKETRRYGGPFIGNLLGGLWVYSLFIICLIILPISWIRKKKLYDSVEVDPINKTIGIGSGGVVKSYDIEDIAFAFHEYKFYSVIVLHEKFTGTRGQPYLEEIADFTGFAINISWGRQQLKAMTQSFRGFEIEECHKKDKAMLDRIF